MKKNYRQLFFTTKTQREVIFTAFLARSSGMVKVWGCVYQKVFKKQLLIINVIMETMTVGKISISVLCPLEQFRFRFWPYISEFYDCRKFHYHQVAGEKIINDQNFQMFCF